LQTGSSADWIMMSLRSTLATLACAVSLLGAAVAMPASASAAHSVGTPGQIAWVRSAATRFVTAELAGDGASACGILNAPLRATERGHTCTQRWNAKLTELLRQTGARARLRSQKRAISSAVVVVHGNWATIALPVALAADASNRFVWTENCWMLAG
jgi:hypothetical protein